MDWNNAFASRTLRMKPSMIRQLLALTQQPEIISFAGGLPDPALFPVDELNEAMSRVIKNNASAVLQYGETLGYRPLRETILTMTQKEGLKDIGPENLIVTTASQQGIDLVGKVFIDEGDTVIVEGPTYLAALQSWNVYGANFETVPMDDDGMMMDKLEESLNKLKSKGVKPKFIYTIPTFQNPAGITMNLERRKKLLELAYRFDTPIIEDNPYGDLRFTGEHVPSLAALDDRGMVVYLRTFSKILCPGLRLGWIVSNKDVIKKISLAKEAADLCTPVVTQAATNEWVKMGGLDRHIPKIIASYSKKRELMVEMMKMHFPQGVKWTKAEGGMFIWATLDPKVNATELFPKALEHKVAYIVGEAFYSNGMGKNAIRLNFSYPNHSQIEEGIKRLGELLKSIS